MTDDAFNRYLKRRISREIPSVCDGDACVEIHDGHPMIRVGSGGYEQYGCFSVGGPNRARSAQIVAFGLQLCAEELDRRSHEE